MSVKTSPRYTLIAAISVIILLGIWYPLAAQSPVVDEAVEGRTQELEKDIDRELSDLIKGSTSVDTIYEATKSITALVQDWQIDALNALDGKVLYGPDDRFDFYQAAPALQSVASSIALVVDTRSLTPTVSGFSLPSDRTGEEMGWCRSESYQERFYDQPSPGWCTAFLVTPQHVATAGHCIRGLPGDLCSEISFVFGFVMRSATDLPTAGIPADRVYQCSKIIDGTDEAQGADWRVIELDRPVQGRVPLKLAQTKIADTATVAAWGHPVGLPLKLADNGKIRRNTNQSFFVTTLDTYGGNSGSPVFDLQSLKNGAPVVEGILVRGEADYVWMSNCYGSKICAEDACRGEDVTRATLLSDTVATLLAASAHRLAVTAPALRQP